MAKIRPRLTAREQDSVTWQSERLAGLSLDFVLLNAVSGLLASFGLLQNSPAVGDRGEAGGTAPRPAHGYFRRSGHGQRPSEPPSVDLGTGRSRNRCAGGWILGLVVPLESPTTEMLARASPSLLDAGVAVVGSGVFLWFGMRPAQVAAVERGLETRFGIDVELSVVVERVVRADQ